MQLEPARGRRLSEDTALGLSLGGTLASWALLIGGGAGGSTPVFLAGLAGTFVAPNMGHWYQGKIVTAGTGLRALGALTTAGGLFMGALCAPSNEGCGGSIAAVFFGGVALYIGATVYDIRDAPRRVRKHNHRFEAIRIAPMAADRAAGLVLGGHF